MQYAEFFLKFIVLEWWKYVRDDIRTKKTFQFGHCPGGGLPLPEFFCALFLLKQKVSSMVATAEKVVEVARIGGWGGGVWLIRAMPELKRFFCFALVP